MDALDLNEIDVPHTSFESIQIDNEIKKSSKLDVTADSVRSSAVVTYSAAKFPALFSQLAPSTNLNLAPSNWLRNAPGLRPDVLLSGSRAFPAYSRQDVPVFSSFQMADSHLDYMGEIDVISDAENFKKLLKVPYSKAHVSMAVHRVGKTLLLENFDITHDSIRVHGWEWFKTKYEELTQRGASKKKLPSAQLDRQLLSKFLYYSLHENPASKESQDKFQSAMNIEEICSNGNQANEISSYGRRTESQIKTTDIKPEKLIIPAEVRWKYWTPNTTEASECNDADAFERTIFWTFEDLQMLLGTNMPIFGGGEYPAVSLRLRDSNKPINILTGIDYWLDNLICNVPEVVMCFHVNGIVQNYEVLKTEEIPKLTNTKFSPKVIKDIAQNILSFLKSNCTKEGHTYWLFKGSNEDVVKLYDLTTLCHPKDSNLNSDDDSHNPFTISVATLLYKMAVNLMQQPVNMSNQTSTIKRLLHNCVRLLEKRAQLAPVMYDAALCMLSTLCLPDSADDVGFVPVDNNASNFMPRNRTSSLTFSECSPNNATTKNSQNKAEIAVIPSVNELSIPERFKSQNSSNADTTIDSVLDEEYSYCAALSYVIRGLDVFDRFSNKELNIPVADDCKDLLIVHMQMVRNTTLIYYASAKHAYSLQHYARCFQCIRIALLGYEYLEHLIEFKVQQGAEDEVQTENDSSIASVLQGTIPPDFNLLLPRLLTLCGDVQMLQCHWNQQEKVVFEKELENVSEDDIAINKALVKNFSGVGEKYGHVSKIATIPEKILSNCYACYQTALLKLPSTHDCGNSKANKPLGKYKVGKENSKKSKTENKTSEDKASLRFSATRKLGHVANEQGAIQLNKSIELLTVGDVEHDSITEKAVWKSSFDLLQKSLNCFADVNDFTNQALVLSNLGRLMRVCAQSTAQHEDDKFTSHEQQLYDSAIDYYKKALSVQQQVKVRRTTTAEEFTECSVPMVNDNISWELSGTYFTMAKRLQDHAPLNIRTQNEIEREILDLLNKSLKHCSEIWKRTAKRQQALHRCANIHSRLASLYHNSFRQSSEVSKKRQFRTLAEGQYEKACALYISLPDEYMCEFLRVLLERLALREQQLPGVTNQSVKLKLILESVEILLNCVKPVSAFLFSLENYIQSFDSVKSTSVDPQNYSDKDSVISGHSNVEEWGSLFQILSTILKSLLLSLLKLTVPSASMKNTSKKKPQNLINDLPAHTHYKEIYSRTLRLQTFEVLNYSLSDAESIAQMLLHKGKSLLEIIKDLKSQ